MDNNNYYNNNNDFYGDNPQKPFTEKSAQGTIDNNNAEQQNSKSAKDFTPQPYEQYAVHRPAPDYSNPQPETKFEPPYSDYIPKQSNPDAYKHNDYSQPSYVNPHMNNHHNEQYMPKYYAQQNVQNTNANAENSNYQNTNTTVTGFNNSPNYTQSNTNSNNNAYQNIPNYQQAQTNAGSPYNNSPYAYTGRNNTPKKSNAGLIVVIIVLSVLLLGSVIGMAVFALNYRAGEGKDETEPSEFFGFTIPGYTFPQIAEETTPTGEHKESDYSNKTDKEFKGIELNEKPEDAGKNSGYNSEYAYKRISDCVVGVVCYSEKITSVENCSSQGSGIILTSDGYVLTNSHVIDNSKTAYLIQVVLANGDTYNAGVVGYDTRTDIAVLKMDNAKDLKYAEFGNSDQIILGEDILAVGNPGGLDYQNSITKGVVSAINRELSATSLVKYIQTDAAINPGNSGGPVVNMYGQVIGIATAKIVSEQYEGMGFAIPTNTAKTIADSLIRNGYVAGRVKIGIVGTAVNSYNSISDEIPNGILVSSISKGGPCENSGLKADDSVITSAGGAKIESFADIYNVLEKYKAGDKLEIKYYSIKDKKEYTTTITLQEDIQ
ncbi:MAG: trypsin-like peptidase domain-containing protein [Ruminococcus sp.]|nr:trypsin-like peptidase domain-containing protein [Ruminococcus sp.]